jgi:hypothetical protein
MLGPPQFAPLDPALHPILTAMTGGGGMGGPPTQPPAPLDKPNPTDAKPIPKPIRPPNPMVDPVDAIEFGQRPGQLPPGYRPPWLREWSPRG